MTNAPFIFRFTHDLRVEDHAGLVQAAAHGEVLPVFVIDRAFEARMARSPRRAAYAVAALSALDRALRERGARLIVRRGTAAAILKQVARASGARGVAWTARYDGAGAQADDRLRSELEEAGLRALVVHDAPAIAPEETAAARPSGGNGYRAFVPYFEVWRTLAVAAFDAPLLVRFAATDLQSEPLPQASEFNASGGASAVAALDVREGLMRFLAGAALQYASGMNVPSLDGTARLSAHLSFGVISARSVVRATRKRLEDPFLLSEERASLRIFLRSLAMRDFFLQLAFFHPYADNEPLQERMRAFTFARSHRALDAWRAGTTGFPLVDAGMRELHETGWMHPHVRAVAASFLCYDLGVDWRVGRDEWDRYLVEDDPALATGNWQWIAGVGADLVQYPRIYNPDKQRRRFDPNGAYVKRYVHELAAVPVAAWDGAHAREGQLSLALFAHDDYPQPVVDHDEAARAFLARYRAFVNG